MKAIITIFLLGLALFHAGCEPDLDIDPVNSRTQSVDPGELNVKITDTLVVANGSNLAIVSISAGPTLRKLAYQATLTADPVGSFPNGTKAITLTLDSAGQATTQLASDRGGIATISVQVGTVVRTVTVTFVSKEILLSIGSLSTLADNFSYAAIKASVSGNDLSQPVVFRTLRGHFSNGLDSQSVKPASDGTATAYLRHDHAENVEVSATVSGVFTSRITVPFTIALPGEINVGISANTFPPRLTSEAIVTATLTRSQGTPSVGQSLSFTDSTAGATHPGVFLNTTLSNASGIATARYRLLDTLYRGAVYLSVSVDTGNKQVRGKNIIIVQ